LARFRTRLRLALLLGGFVDGLGVLAIAGAATLLVLRLFGVSPFHGAIRGVETPSPWWIALILLPVVAAVARLRRAEPSARDGAAVDRFEKRFDEIAKQHGLREEAKQEVEKRIEAMKERTEKGEGLSWADLDAAEEKMQSETSRRAAEMAKAKAASAQFAAKDP